MVQTRRQAARGADWLRRRGRMPTGYTFVNDMWRICTKHPKRHWRELDDGTIVPACPVKRLPLMVQPSDPPPTRSARAALADSVLWCNSSSTADYEALKKAKVKREAARQAAFIASVPSFTIFPELPPELRLQIWNAALDELTEVTIARRLYFSLGCVEDNATAVLPPLMLVNEEAHVVASARCRRAFKRADGKGGVLTGPTRLTIQLMGIVFPKLDDSDLQLIHEITVDARFGWVHILAMPLQAFRPIFCGCRNLKTLRVLSPESRASNNILLDELPGYLRRLALAEPEPTSQPPRIDFLLFEGLDQEHPTTTWSWQGKLSEMPDAYPLSGLVVGGLDA